MRSFRYFILSAFLCVATYATAQKKELNKDVWKDAVNEIEYIENGEKRLQQPSDGDSPMDFDDFKRKDKKNNTDNYEDERNSERSRNESGNYSIPSWVSTFLIVLVIGLLLYFIVLTVLKNPSIGADQSKSYELNEEELKNIEQNPFENDLERLIHEAKTAGNLKLAIRLSFIYTIRLLAENGIINWKKDKTNSQYLAELEGAQFKTTYVDLRLLYETVWYGEIDLKPSGNKAALSRFEHGINTLKTPTKI